MFRFAAAMTTALTLSSLPVHAETPPACPYKPLIAEMSQRLLAERPLLKRFAKRRFGADESHMLIHYGDLTNVQIREMLIRLRDDKARRISELALAWA